MGEKRELNGIVYKGAVFLKTRTFGIGYVYDTNEIIKKLRYFFRLATHGTL